MSGLAIDRAIRGYMCTYTIVTSEDREGGWEIEPAKREKQIKNRITGTQSYIYIQNHLRWKDGANICDVLIWDTESNYALYVTARYAFGFVNNYQSNRNIN